MLTSWLWHSMLSSCHAKLTVLSIALQHAEEDRLEVRRQTNEQDKHLDTIADALNDLQRIGEVCHKMTHCTSCCIGHPGAHSALLK